MIAALGKMQEFETHTRGALRNGLTPNEIRAVLTPGCRYCGSRSGSTALSGWPAKVINESKAS